MLAPKRDGLAGGCRCTDVHQGVENLFPEPGRDSVRRRRSRTIGSEGSLRAAIEDGERLLVCASVRFANPSAEERLWLTDRRILFARKSGRHKRVVGVPISKCTLDYDDTSPYPIRLSWSDEIGAPGAESLRAKTWKDDFGQGSGSAVAGATGGIEAAVIVGALQRAINNVVGSVGSASADRKLFATLAAALDAPALVRPLDLTAGSLNTHGGRLLIALVMAISTTSFLASAVYAVISYQTLLAYDVTPICERAAAPSCRQQESAIMTSHRGIAGKDGFCDVTMSRRDGSTVSAELLSVGFCSQPLDARAMTIESWRRSITAVIPPGGPAEETSGSPAYHWRLGIAFTGATGLVWLIFAIAGFFELRSWLARRALLQASAHSAGFVT